MRGRLSVAALVAVVAASACSPAGQPATTRTIPDGTTAPSSAAEPAADFTVPLLGGGTFTLAEHVAGDGRPVFLNLWASWCLPCREEMPAIDAAAARHPGVLFLGVAVQDAEAEATAFAEEIGVTYPLGFDDGGVVDAAYRPLGLPVSYIISGEGILLEEFYGRLDEEIIDQKVAAWFGG